MTKYLLQSVRQLRQQEEALLYGYLLTPSEEDQAETVRFLEAEYHRESPEYPYLVPPFNPAAAGWAARTVYLAIQWIVYREHTAKELAHLLPDYPGEATASALLSADLLLRFLPDIITQVRLIDAEDHLVNLLEDKLHRWHYSGVAYPLTPERLSFDAVTVDACVYQLYVDRVITHRNVFLAHHPALEEGIRASLGMFAPNFWQDFEDQPL